MWVVPLTRYDGDDVYVLYNQGWHRELFKNGQLPASFSLFLSFLSSCQTINVFFIKNGGGFEPGSSSVFCQLCRNHCQSTEDYLCIMLDTNDEFKR